MLSKFSISSLWLKLKGFTYLSMVVILMVPRSHAQVFSPYSDFEAMSPTDLQTLQILLTSIGAPQDEIIPSIAITAVGNSIDVKKFVPFERPAFSYTDRPVTLTASTQELKAIITNIGTLSNVRQGGVAAAPRFSFLMVNLSKGFEAVINVADTAALFDKLRQGLATNKSGLFLLQTQTCPLNFLEPGAPSDVSNATTVAMSGFRLNRRTNRFVGSASVKNTSASAIAGPVSLVVFTNASVSLANPDGLTCNTVPAGAAFVNLPNGNGLAPGETAQITLEFTNPNFVAIKPTTKRLAGTGAR